MPTSARSLGTQPQHAVETIKPTRIQRLSRLFQREGGVERIKAFAVAVPAEAAGIEVTITSRYGSWDPRGVLAEDRGRRIITFLRDVRGINAAYKLVLDNSTAAEVTKHGAVTVGAAYAVIR